MSRKKDGLQSGLHACGSAADNRGYIVNRLLVIV